MEDWPFGVEVMPDGELAREFAQRLPVWSSAVWITESGTAYRRYMSSRGPTSRERIDLAQDPESGRFGYNLSGCGFVGVETAIATAFHPRAPGSRRRAYVLDASVELSVSNVAWREPEVLLEGDDEGDDETWEPLVWRIGMSACDGLGFEISSLGRLRHGTHVTKGFAAHGTRWAATPAGLVNLLAAAQLQRYSVRPPPRVEAAYHSFVASVPPDMHAEIVDCTEKQAWTNYQLAAPMVARRRKIARDWIDTSVWEALEDLSDDPFLEGRLSELKEHVEDVVGRAVEFDHVRLARLCLL